KEEREESVKRAVNRVLIKAAEEVKTKAQIQIAVVGFNGNAQVIVEPIQVTSSNMEDLTRKVDGYSSSGNTNLEAGLNKAIEQMNLMKKRDSQAEQVLILLTD